MKFGPKLPKMHSAGETNRDRKKDHQRDWTMKTILASSTVLFTILFSLGFGIACGYAVISTILRAFAHRPEVEKAPATAVITVSSH